MAEKFFLPATILEAHSYNQAVKAGSDNPFQPEEPRLVIASYHFARNKADDVVATPWDLVVIDEAHRLRNVYKSSNVIATALKKALDETAEEWPEDSATDPLTATDRDALAAEIADLGAFAELAVSIYQQCRQPEQIRANSNPSLPRKGSSPSAGGCVDNNPILL